MKLQHPLAVVCGDSEGHMIYVADSYNHKVLLVLIIILYCYNPDQIKVVDVTSKNCSTLAGIGKACLKDGSFSEAGFSEPGGLCLSGNLLYIADTNNHCIRVMNLLDKTVVQVS